MADRAELILNVGVSYFSGAKSRKLHIRVLIDGKPLGVLNFATPEAKNNPDQPFNVQLDPGPHRITARSEGEEKTFEADFEMGTSTRWAELRYHLYSKNHRGDREAFDFLIQDEGFDWNSPES